METNAVDLLKHGGALIKQAGDAFLKEMNWSREEIDRVIAHQVAAANREAILANLGVGRDKDFSTFPYLGNMGTVSLPTTAKIAQERGIIEKGQKVAFVGIGSGLNSLMLGWQW